jgi:hypothetical protein
VVAQTRDATYVTPEFNTMVDITQIILVSLIYGTLFKVGEAWLSEYVDCRKNHRDRVMIRQVRTRQNKIRAAIKLVED